MTAGDDTTDDRRGRPKSAQVTAVDTPTALSDDGEAWPIADSETVWENPYFSAGYDVIEQPDGGTNTFYWVDPADVVAVVAETDDRIVLLDQYDARLGRSVLTCPGGGVEDGESFVEAGVRELREETGFVAGEAELLTTYNPSMWLRMEQAVVYATDLEPGPVDRDSGEFLDVYAVPVDAAVEAVEERSPSFGPALTSLLLARSEGVL